MGTYVYLYTKTPAVKAYLPNGEQVVLAHYRYGFKPYMIGDDPKSFALMAGKAAKVFERSPSREYAFQGDAPKDGMSVYTSLESSEWYDCQDFPGILVGWLKKLGTQWHVVTEKTETFGSCVSVCKIVAPGMYSIDVTGTGESQVYDTRPRSMVATIDYSHVVSGRYSSNP